MKAIHIRTGAWYGDHIKTYEFPEDVTIDVLAPRNAVPVTDHEINDKINHPFGLSLTELAANKINIIIVTDDLGRPTPSHDIIPFILNILRQTGVKKENISFLIATGSHRQLTTNELEKKLGAEIVRNYRAESHDAFNSSMADLGTTRKGFPCIVNEQVARADLIIGIGCVIPHSCHGFGGGAKLFLPGVADMKSIVAMHGFTPKRGRGRNKKQSLDMRTAAEDITDKLPPVFLINAVMNTERKICGLFAGDHRQVFSAASELARSVYETAIDKERLKKYDIVIVNAYPLDADTVQSDKVHWVKSIFKHCFPVYVNAAVDNIDYHGWKVLRRHSFFNLACMLSAELITALTARFPFLMRIIHPILKIFFRMIINKIIKPRSMDFRSFSGFRKATHSNPNRVNRNPLSAKSWLYSEHYSPELFYKKHKKGFLFTDWKNAAEMIAKRFPKANIAILPCASVQIPIIRNQEKKK